MNSESKTFSCVLCESKLASKEALQEHFRKHANKEIDTKGKPIAKPAEGEKVKAVVEADVNKETIQCDVCLMTFETVTHAIQHKFRKHPESSVKFYCSFCGMQFPLKFLRDKHVKSHSGMSALGSFPCSDCGVIFHNVQAQSYHDKSTHKRIKAIFKPIPTPPPSKKIKINNSNEAQSVYYCYLCGSEYIIKFNLQKHLERSHSEEERNAIPQDLIKCTTCDALFYNKRAYDTHNMYHKPDDLYVTSEEQRLQTISRIDQDFDIRRVQMTADKFIPVDKPIKRRQQSIRREQEAKTKQKKGFTITSDEELSPDSSIDSSDSESELKITEKPTNETPIKETHTTKAEEPIKETKIVKKETTVVKKETKPVKKDTKPVKKEPKVVKSEAKVSNDKPRSKRDPATSQRAVKKLKTTSN